MNRRFAPWAPLALLAALSVPAAAAPKVPERAPEPTTGREMDYGPFLTGSLDRDKSVSEKNSKESTEQNGPHPNALAAKAVNVRLAHGQAGVAFDTDLLRYAAGWTGGFLDLSKTHLTSLKGSTALTPQGQLLFATPPLPGVSPSGTVDDVRDRPYGPLPKQFARYKGLYRHADRVVFSYRVGDVDVLDSPAYVMAGDTAAIVRTVRVGPSKDPIHLRLFDIPAEGVNTRLTDAGLVIEGPEESLGTGLTTRLIVGVPRPGGLALLDESHPLGVVEIRPRGEPFSFSILVRRTQRHILDETVALLVKVGNKDPVAWTRGGPSIYGETVVTKGVVGTGDGAYVIDTLTIPFDNPWKSWMRPTGLDFFPDGRLALCTLNGDVWVVSGIDDKLERLSWRRFATGLYEPLGLKVAGGKVHVLGRDQITRLHDLNDDGEADFYENFNHDAPASANYHGFAMELAADSAGNFYYTRAGQRMHPGLPHHGALLRVSKDGSKLDVVASGLRAANGLCVGPGDLITVADNQGNWTPSSRINVIRPGGFYGYMPHVTAGGALQERSDHDPPLCWIPVTVDNSSGSQAWSDRNRFGPLGNRMFHTSYGKAGLFLVTTQKLDEHLYQGGVIQMPFRFDSGVMRGRVNPKDGQLYLCGLRGWQTDGTKDGTLCRVRYTGQPLHMPLDCKVVPGGLEITFSAELDQETAEDVGSYGIEQWNYKWSADYGSPEISVKDPSKVGRDEVEVGSATLKPDGKTVFLKIPDLRPVMQMRVSVDVDTTDGKTITDTLYLTIHQVPE